MALVLRCHFPAHVVDPAKPFRPLFHHHRLDLAAQSLNRGFFFPLLPFRRLWAKMMVSDSPRGQEIKYGQRDHFSR